MSPTLFPFSKAYINTQDHGTQPFSHGTILTSSNRSATRCTIANHYNSAKATFNDHLGDFSNSMQGFSELRDQAKINVQPTRLDVVRTPRGGTLQEFIPSSLPDKFTAEDVAILNQITLSSAVGSGVQIKLVQ